MYRKLLLLAILLSGIGYLLAMAGDNMILRWILKPGTILLIILLTAASPTLTKSYKYLVMTGLFLSAIGDSFLLLSGDKWFTFGLVSFLIAHLIYTSAFMNRWRFSPAHLIALVPIGLYSFFFLQGLHGGMMEGGDSGLWLPVLIYVLVISIMIWSAVASRSWWAISGAILFFLSDSLLAWDMFVTSVPYAGYGVMITYYSAQFLIASSVSAENKAIHSPIKQTVRQDAV